MPTTSRRTVRLGVLLAVVVAAFTLGLSNAAWAQLVTPSDVADNAFAARDVDVSNFLNDINICGISVDHIGVDVNGVLGRGSDVTFCHIVSQIDDE